MVVGMRAAAFYESAELIEQNLTMNELKCWNCGEDCFEELGEENPAIVPIHYFVEKKQVCGDCYQILHELSRLG